MSNLCGAVNLCTWRIRNSCRHISNNHCNSFCWSHTICHQTHPGKLPHIVNTNLLAFYCLFHIADSTFSILILFCIINQICRIPFGWLPCSYIGNLPSMLLHPLHWEGSWLSGSLDPEFHKLLIASEHVVQSLGEIKNVSNLCWSNTGCRDLFLQMMNFH